MAGTERLHVSVNGAPFVVSPLDPLGANLYSATLPAAACSASIGYYVSAQLSTGATFTGPAGAPAAFNETTAGDGSLVLLRDEFEGDVSAWTVVNHPSLTGGAWQQADPNGTISGGAMAAPEDDATQADDAVQCFVTQNGVPGGLAGAADVDGGPTHLITPNFNLAGTDATLSYARWFFCNNASIPTLGDALRTEISNDGGVTWFEVHSTQGTGSQWETVAFDVSDIVTPTATVRIRFTTSDPGNNSTTEAGIDNFQIEEVFCDVPGDLDVNGLVNLDDHALWTDCMTGPGAAVQMGCEAADLQADNDVDLADFAGFENGFDG